MSRIIIKSLPKDISKDKLVDHIQKTCPGVEVTDCNLKYTKEGVFRRFAFVGFNTSSDATSSQRKLNGTFIRTTKIQTDIAVDVGDGNVKSWSKYTGSNAQHNKDNATNTAKVADTNVEGSNQDSGNANKSGFTVKMKGMTGHYSEKSIKEFFKPIKPAKVKLFRNAQKKPLGNALVEFSNQKDLDLAMGRNKNFINGKKIFLKKSAEEMSEEKKAPAPPVWEVKAKESNEQVESIGESGRLFVRNLWFGITEGELEGVFSKFGPLAEVSLPVDSLTKKVKGFAHVVFVFPEHALKAYTELDYTQLHGRLMHILPGREALTQEGSDERSSFKKKKDMQQKANSSNSHNWNSLFLAANAVADAMAKKYETDKSRILDSDAKGSVGVRMALGETQIVAETRDFLIENGVALDTFSQAAGERSKTSILVKNLPSGVSPDELRDIFARHGSIARLVMPPSGITAIVEYLEPSEAKKGFLKLNFSKFRSIPLYLEWAPMGVFSTPAPRLPVKEESEDESDDETDDETDDESGKEEEQDGEKKDKVVVKETKKDVKQEEVEDISETEPEEGASIFVKNLNFDTNDEQLSQHFEGIGTIHSATVAKKKDPKRQGELLSMGYGFVQFLYQREAKEALKTLQNSTLDGHHLELKVSTRSTQQASSRQKQTLTKQTSSKILVRNIPFEANINEIQELFKVFGQLKFVRLPKKLRGTGPHRGFAFVDFITKEDAKRAFNALCHSTHLYGRRLVLEWAQAEESLDDLRRKTAAHFSDDGPKRKVSKASLMKELE